MVAAMSEIRVGPARVPSRESPEAAVGLLQERGYRACEIDFEGGFWMDYPWAECFGRIAREAGIVLSVHAPLAGLLGRTRERALADVVEQLAELRERLVGKGRDVPFGVEVMGRVNELGTAEDVFAIAAQLDWVRPVIDFAHLHAVTDGAFTETETFAGV